MRHRFSAVLLGPVCPAIIDTSMASITSGEQVARMLIEARTRTLELVEDLGDDQMLGPKLRIVNPPLWEIGHVAWFEEKWALRHLRALDTCRGDIDALYDSAAIAHDVRWDLPLPERRKTLGLMQQVRETVLDRLAPGELDDAERYFHLLPLFHEDMHAEAITYTRQTLEYPAPRLGLERAPIPEGGGPLPGDVHVPGGVLMMGAPQDAPFAFDNEKWAHPVVVQPFSIAHAAVTNAEFAAFVDDAGYTTDGWWSEAGRKWKHSARAEHPVYWQPGVAGWSRRVFDRWVPLEPFLPVLHVNWYEAQAYCSWAGRRLPTEAEWEMAASAEPRELASGQVVHKRTFPWGESPPTPERANLEWRYGGLLDVGALPAGDSALGCRQMIGNVWEWVADDFQPYAGFVVDPYKEYSAPWFGNHKVLRGGCWTTRAHLIRNTWRNFYTPDRRDVWCGFRTCATEQ
jgi:gamma-glutamyl hercynylcysteine S-oxide synthase